MKTLRDLLIHEVQDLYSAETQLIEAMPEMRDTVTNHELKAIMDEHFEETKTQRDRLIDVCKSLGVSPEGETCKAMSGLVREAKDMIEMEAEDEVKDAGMISATQRIEHYEIAGYGAACTYAEMIGEDEALKLLKKTLSEEKAADSKLMDLAKSKINKEAMA